MELQIHEIIAFSLLSNIHFPIIHFYIIEIQVLKLLSPYVIVIPEYGRT